ncbi:hypothetical protein E2C01_101166 [Portunus trituberculatus]|uniref:Uncharacterized protein n=1 Tax=Portunus trituberculatus TaxID=210409 RepID=A0A5B7KEY0_PORTR|nr:hypothetical protein [Portunus trituberculatus]
MQVRVILAGTVEYLCPPVSFRDVQGTLGQLVCLLPVVTGSGKRSVVDQERQWCGKQGRRCSLSPNY